MRPATIHRNIRPFLSYTSLARLAVAAVGFCSSALAQQPEWTGPILPASNAGNGMAYDAARGVTVMCGNNQTWEWNESAWVLRATTGPTGGILAYDSARGVTVLVGGSTGTYHDTWEWNGNSWALRATTGPSRRFGRAIAFDATRGVCVLFGGGSSAPFSGETWEWDGNTWMLRSSDGPSPRTLHAMAYDAMRGVTVLFGGGTDFGYYSDTWEWNGSAWTLRTNTGPSPRGGHAMVYDASRGVIQLFGGWTWMGGAYGYSSETWEWNGSVWTLRSSPPSAGPSPRRLHAMAYDANRGVTVLFGGEVSNWDYSGETWEWIGSTWTLRSPGGPSGREFAAMAYDSVRDMTVIFGGDGSDGGDKTWEWDGCAWALRPISGPSARAYHTMSYDSARGVTVLFGGFAWAGANNAETWEWEGSVWEQRSSTGPSARYGHAMAYDSARGVTVIFGGVTDSGGKYGTFNGETWEWNGSKWTQRTNSGPSPREFAAMAYDAVRGVTVLFGGATNTDPYELNGETWEWDGSAWTLRSSTGPSPREYHAMAYDSGRGVTMLFGGLTLNGQVWSETWEWNGSNWTLHTNIGPSIPWGSAMAYDSVRGVTVLFGGYYGETWEYGGSACAPAAVVQQPTSRTVGPGQSAVFSVTATGSPPLSYQWRKNGLNLMNGGAVLGATSSDLIINPVAQADAGV